MSKEVKTVDKNIYNINIDKVENGYVVGYLQDNKTKRRVFYTWLEMVDWLHTQNDSIKEIPRPGVPSANGGTTNLVPEGPDLKGE
jgi:hypothetical protein